MIAGDDDFEVMDRQVLQSFEHMTSGADAHHVRCPDELLMEAEEGEDPRPWRDRLREEIFAATCDFVFSRGVHPEAVRLKIESILRRFASDAFVKMGAPRPWWNEVEVQRVVVDHQARLAARGEEAWDCGAFLLSVSGKLREEKDEEFVYQSFRGICDFWISEDCTWKHAVAAHFALVKALRPQLISGMNLDDIAVICGDKGKATVSARIKRLLNRRLEREGMLGTFFHFQKSAEAVAHYRDAAKGNSNRNKNKQPKIA